MRAWRVLVSREPQAMRLDGAWFAALIASVSLGK
jgi:hypothetical protein